VAVSPETYVFINTQTAVENKRLMQIPTIAHATDNTAVHGQRQGQPEVADLGAGQTMWHDRSQGPVVSWSGCLD
jgi:hypothetical protein